MNLLTRRQSILLPFVPILPARAAEPTSFVASIGGGAISVQIVEGRVASLDFLSAWVDRAAQAVSRFYGRFPVDHVLLLVEVRETGSAVRRGTTFPGAPPFINVTVRGDARAEELRDDWVLTHEFIHLAFPSLPSPHLWLEEGLSTYVEPLARVRAGQIDLFDYWSRLVHSLPQGQPRPNDGGLDGSRGRLRIYWGGALFCFAADLELRKTLGPTHGLQEALQQFVRESVTIDTAWPVRRALQFADERLGVRVLSQLYEEWATRPVHLDLNQIWSDLGIQVEGSQLTFDDSAPQAEIRRSITALE